jgi:hypothetical protein
MNSLKTVGRVLTRRTPGGEGMAGQDPPYEGYADA